MMSGQGYTYVAWHPPKNVQVYPPETVFDSEGCEIEVV